MATQQPAYRAFTVVKRDMKLSEAQERRVTERVGSELCG